MFVRSFAALIVMILARSSDVVKLEVLVHAEPFAERAGEHAAPRRRADDRELLEREIDRPRRHPFAQHDVDAEIFHHRIDEFLDGAWAGGGSRR